MLVANIFKQLSRFIAVLGLTLFALPTASAWSIFGQPQNKQECMLQNLKGVDNETVAQMIVLACEKLFPLKTASEKKCNERDLTPPELGNLEWTKGESKYVSEPYFSVRLYNGNKKLHITAATIEISNPIPINNPFDQFDEPEKSKDKKSFTFNEAKIVARLSEQQYDLFFSKAITPNSAGSLGSTILDIPNAGWSWKVVSVRTCS